MHGDADPRPRIVLVHGSVLGGPATWSAQRPLAERFDLDVLERPGFPPGPPVERVDFEADAVLVARRLRAGDHLRRGGPSRAHLRRGGPSRAHLVGHSYGGVVALLAAALEPGRVASLTVVEPPATRVALDVEAVAAFADGVADWWANGPRDPEAFLRGFLDTVGSGFDPPSPLPPPVEQGARMLMVERGPWEAEIPLEAIAAAPFPKLVVSGGHHPAFDAICDVLAERLPAELVVLRGYGHAAQRHPDFNEYLAEFVLRAQTRTSAL